MNILVVNDDGFQSPGFAALVLGLSKVADVYVCAPDGQRSAKSHSITLGGELTVEEIDFPGAKKAFKASGTPADCTKIGLQFLEEAGIGVDMVYSGINMGSNLGKDTLYSGTVGAAAEASLSGFQAVAVSVDDHEAIYFDTAVKLSVNLIDLIYRKLDPSVVISINVPNLPAEQIKGIKYTRLGQRFYDDKFHPVGQNRYALSGEPVKPSEGECDTDVAAIYENYATITPLQFDFTDWTTLEKVKEWSLNI